MIALSTFLEFVDVAVGAMADTLDRLGDDNVNRRPSLPAANSPAAIVVHCCGVMEWWGGHIIAGRPVSRDRAAEFRATGSVADLQRLLRGQRRQLSADLTAMVADQPTRGEVPADGTHGRPQPTQGHAALHIYEELAQHLGHLDITTDVLLNA